MKLGKHVVASTTPAEGGEITSAPAGLATSLAASITAGAAGVVEQRTADDSPPSVGSDEIIDFDLSGIFEDDDTDQNAFPRARRLICSASTDGQITVHRKGDIGLVLNADEARTLYEFLGDSARVWGKALA